MRYLLALILVAALSGCAAYRNPGYAAPADIDPATAAMFWQNYNQQMQMQQIQQQMRDMSDNYQRMNGYHVPPLIGY